MLKRLFGGGKPPAATRGDDNVWVSDAARLKGVVREAGILAEAERSVLVVALTASMLDALAEALAAHRPARCADAFGRDALRASLAKEGAVAVALASALRTGPSPSAASGADLLVVGRHDRRADDEVIERYADSLGPGAHLAFHLSLEDPLLKRFGGEIRPLLEKLGLKDDEPITHALVTRAIRNAQEKSGA